MNTLTISKRLIKAGMSRHSAEEQAQILNDITHPLATKEGLSRLETRLETRMEEMEAGMNKFATKEDLSRLEARIGGLEAKMDQFATKEDLSRLEARMDKRFSSLQWMIGIMFVALGLIMALLKIL